MGFYLRKSVKVGPLRFNLSKSGVGVSAGVKGLRVGAGPRGNYVHMGRHGIYYRATLPSGAPSASPGSTPVAPTLPPPPVPSDTLTPIESGRVAQMVDASSAELLAELNAKQRRWRTAPWVFAAFVVLGVIAINISASARSNAVSASGAVANMLPLLFVAAWVGFTWAAHRYDVMTKTTVLLFNLEDEPAERFEAVHKTFTDVANCGGRWQIEAQGRTTDWKHHAGAGSLIRRKGVTLETDPPRWVKTNIAVPTLPLARETLCLFPDRLLVFSPNGVGAVSYAALTIDVGSGRFIEREGVPKDAKVVGQTWQYPNKSGGPDKRFKNNRQIPIALYEEVAIKSTSGVNIALQLSRLGVGEPFRNAVAQLGAHVGQTATA
jgi:hypothetical protein